MKKLLVILALCMVLSVVLVACETPETPENPTDNVTTQKPTEAPTTNEPTTNEPTTNEPTTGEPTTGEPTDEPTTDEPTTEESTTEEQPPVVEVFEGNWHASVDSFMYCVNDDFSDVVAFTGANTNNVIGTTITNAAQETLASVTANYVYFDNGWLAVDGYAIENWALSIYAADGTLLKTVALTLRDAEEGVVNHVSQNMHYAEGTVSHRVGQLDAEIISLKEFQGQNVTVVYSVDVVGTEFTVDLIKLDVAVPVDPNAPLFVLDAATIAGSTNMNEVASITASEDGTYATLVGANDGQYGDAWVSLIAAPTQAAQYLVIKYRTSLDRDGQFFVGSGAGPTGQNDCPMIDYTSNGRWNLAIIDLSTVEAVNENYEINYLRYDFFTDGKGDATIEVGYIAAFNTVEAAQAYDATLADVYVDLYNVPQDNWTVTGHCTGIVGKEGHGNSGMVAAGGVESGALLHQGYIALGEMDLSQFTKLIVYYGLDGSPVTVDCYNNSANNRIILTSADQSMTNSPTDDVILASSTYVDLGWSVKALVIDLSEVFYTGPVFVTYDTLPGTFMLISQVDFVYGDKVAPEPELGSQENPIFVDFAYNETNTGATATVTVPAGATVYYQAYCSGMILSINGENMGVQTAEYPRMPVVFSITNDGEADAEYALAISYPAGTMDNPAQIVLGDNTATIEAGNSQGYFFTYTAQEAGTLTFTISGEAGWVYAINNLTTGKYGDQHWFDDDPVVNPEVIEVAAGDEIQIMVNTYDPADMWNNPAGTITVSVAVGAPVEPEVPAEPVTLIDATYNSAIPEQLTYITNNENYPNPSFYSNGGLKMNYVNMGMQTVAFEAKSSVKVTLNILALNENTKSENGDVDAFTFYGLDANGEVVATTTLNELVVGDNEVTLAGEGIVAVKVIMTDYYYNGSACCNISVGGLKVVG